MSACGEEFKLMLEITWETLICCLPYGHEGSHYDDAFCRSWRCYEAEP